MVAKSGCGRNLAANARLMSLSIDVLAAPPTDSGPPVNPRKLLERLAGGSARNVRFAHFRRLVEAFGFRLKRVSGSHHIFSHPRVPEVANLQEVSGEAKPYQIRQFMRLVERYNLKLEDGP